MIVEQQAASLAEEGFDVTVVTSDPKGSSADEAVDAETPSDPSWSSATGPGTVWNVGNPLPPVEGRWLCPAVPPRSGE